MNTSIDAINYSKLLLHILQVKNEITELPLIRFPGREWFSIVEGGIPVVSIGSVLAKTQTKPLAISSLAKRNGIKDNKDIQAILLYTPFIPFEIVIDSYFAPQF